MLTSSIPILSTHSKQWTSLFSIIFLIFLHCLGSQWAWWSLVCNVQFNCRPMQSCTYCCVNTFDSFIETVFVKIEVTTTTDTKVILLTLLSQLVFNYPSLCNYVILNYTSQWDTQIWCLVNRHRHNTVTETRRKAQHF